ncbi:MAG TPA: TIGR03435 family protein [Bryobacteraceae bacterium]|nr:TIGR03435 family protein [Bryobacteraceae bacterium]
MTASRLAVCLATASLLCAQPPSNFDVAAIRPADPNNTRFGMGFSTNGRTITVDGLNLAQMIGEAYHVRQEEISLAPSLQNAGWIQSDRYDISAKSEGGSSFSKAESDRLFQQLLADRFSVRIHHEQKEMTVYSLVVGKGGPKLNPGGSAGPYLSRPAPGKFVGTKASMASLARGLTGALGRPVMDDTGLSGGFDFNPHLDA